jgi:glycosyltransferase involved in cell wall biosynthesis
MPQEQTSENPRVSIIIPAYNTAGLISACLDSVLAQTFKDYEIIVVNDGSPDTPELEKVLQPYQSKIVYIRQENKRAAGARNTAIRQARGGYLAFLDSDDLWLPDHLASQMNLITRPPGLDLVYANAIVFGDPENEWEFMQRCTSEGTPDFEALIVERCQVSTCTVVVRKESIVKAGLFDEGLARCDDYEMWLRAAFYGARMGYNRTIQARLNGGRPGSLGASRLKMVEAYRLILEKLLRTLPLTTAQRQLLEHRLAEIRARHLVAQAKVEMQQRHFDEAKRLLAEANESLRASKVTLTLLGLKLAPNTTQNLISFWNQVRRA